MTITKFILRPEPNDSYYLLKAYYTVHTGELRRLEVALSDEGADYVPDPLGYPMRHVSQLRDMMREAGLTPADFTKRLPEFLRSLKSRTPNKAPEPTTTAVTPRAS